MPRTKNKSNEPHGSQNLVKDWYSRVPKSMISRLANPGHAQHLLDVPFRMAICGPSGSGKTTILVDLLKRTSGTFDKIVFVVRSTLEPLYQHIIQEADQSCIEVYEDEKIPNVEQYKEYAMTNRQILVIFDDLVSLPKPKQKPICDFFVKGRKYNISLVFISQDYYKIHKTIRLQLNYIILTKTNSEKDIKLVLSEYSLGQPIRQVMEYYTRAFTQPRDFFMIDIKKPGFRYNWLDTL